MDDPKRRSATRYTEKGNYRLWPADAEDLPTGKCIGWHALTEEQYKQKLAEYREREKQKEHGGSKGAEPNTLRYLGKQR